MSGLIYAFGNTNQSPFHKKFIAGGANDLRGWQAFKRPTGSLEINSDTLFTGGIKLITSLEFRFCLIKKLNGSFFIDAGNIWEISSNNNEYEKANFKWNRFLDEIVKTKFEINKREVSLAEHWFGQQDSNFNPISYIKKLDNFLHLKPGISKDELSIYKSKEKLNKKLKFKEDRK